MGRPTALSKSRVAANKTNNDKDDDDDDSVISSSGNNSSADDENSNDDEKEEEFVEGETEAGAQHQQNNETTTTTSNNGNKNNDGEKEAASPASTSSTAASSPPASLSPPSPSNFIIDGGNDDECESPQNTTNTHRRQRHREHIQRSPSYIRAVEIFDDSNRTAASNAARLLQSRRRLLATSRTTVAGKRRRRRASGRRQSHRTRVVVAVDGDDATCHHHQIRRRRRRRTRPPRSSTTQSLQRRSQRRRRQKRRRYSSSSRPASPATSVVSMNSVDERRNNDDNGDSALEHYGSSPQHQQIEGGNTLVCFASASPASSPHSVMHSPRSRSRRHSGRGHMPSPPSPPPLELIELSLADLERISAGLSTFSTKQTPATVSSLVGSATKNAASAGGAACSAANQTLVSLVECTTRDDVVRCYSEYRQRCDEAMSHIAGNCLAYVCVILELCSDESPSDCTAAPVLERRCNAEKVAIFSQTMRKVLFDLKRVEEQQLVLRSCGDTTSALQQQLQQQQQETGGIRVRLTKLGTLSRVFHHLLSKADENRLYDIDLNMDSIEPLLGAAKILRMDFVQALVARFVVLTMNEQRCLHFLRLALHYRMRELARHAIRRAQLSFAHLVTTNEWLIADPSVVLEVVRSRQLNAAREQQVYDAAMAWIRREPDARRQHLEPIMLQIRFQELNKLALWKAWAELRALVGPGKCAQLEDYIVACVQHSDVELRRCLSPAVQQMVKEPRVFSAHPTSQLTSVQQHHHHHSSSGGGAERRSSSRYASSHHHHQGRRPHVGITSKQPTTSQSVAGSSSSVQQQQQQQPYVVNGALRGGLQSGAAVNRTVGLLSSNISRPHSPLGQARKGSAVLDISPTRSTVMCEGVGRVL